MAITTICGPTSSVAAGGSAGVPVFRTVTGDGLGQGSSIENILAQFAVRFPGTFSNLQVSVDNQGTARTIRFRKNTANGNQVINPTDSTAGFFTDATHTDAVIAGDLLDLSEVWSTTAMTVFTAVSNFTASSGNPVTFYSTAISLAITAQSYASMNGAFISNTEAQAQTLVRAPGTLKNFAINFSANTSVSTTYFVRKNGANGNCTILVPGSTTGLVEDTTHTDSVASGDLINILIPNNGLGSVITGIMFCGIEGSSQSNDMFSAPVSVVTASGSPQYLPVCGACDAQATEASVQIRYLPSVTTSRFRANIAVNSFTSTATFKVRKNGVDTGETFTVGAGATGQFEDTSHSDAWVLNDLISYSITGGTSNTMTIGMLGLTQTSPPATVPSSSGQFTSVVRRVRAIGY